MECTDAERRVELVPQLLAVAVLDPGIHFGRREPERERREERAAFGLARVVVRSVMTELCRSACDRAEALERWD
jgi:hypothetical protein